MKALKYCFPSRMLSCTYYLLARLMMKMRRRWWWRWGWYVWLYIKAGFAYLNPITVILPYRLCLYCQPSPVFPPFIRIIIIGAKDNLTTDTVRLRKVPWWYVHDSFRNKNKIKQSFYFSSLSPCMRLVITRIYEFPSDPFAFLWHVPLPCSYTMSGIMVLMAVSIK